MEGTGPGAKAHSQSGGDAVRVCREQDVEGCVMLGELEKEAVWGEG